MQAHTVALAHGLAHAGHEVEVITARHPAGLEVDEYQGARWHFVPVPTRYGRLPIRHHAWLRGSAAKFETLHDVRPFDVVHSESTSALGLLRRGVHRRVPVVVKFHGNYLGLVSTSVRRASRGDAHLRFAEAKYVVWVSADHFVPPGTVFRFRSCEAMVASRQQLRGTRRSYLLNPERVHVVPNGVDTSNYRPRDRESARRALGLDATSILLCVARFQRQKGIQHAIAAVAEIPHAHLILVGHGEERAVLEGLASAPEVVGRVHFVGPKTPTEVAAYMAAADVFLFPTELPEPASVVLLEAMASGLPVVASDIGAITEVIDRPNENGVLVPPGDVNALRVETLRLLADDGLRSEIGQAARARIESEYTLERMVERTVQVYDIARRRALRPHGDGG
jgi:glycosyltransferase involved in cell wall biosynthesis